MRAVTLGKIITKLYFKLLLIYLFVLLFISLFGIFLYFEYYIR